MATVNSKKLDSARSIIKKEKNFTINKLVSILKCSSRTAQAKLKLWKTYTSYNQNGKYYDLAEIPHFNDYGLWRFKKAAFSKHGNLKKTIVYLASSASNGLTGKQIGEILGLSPQSFLHHFRKCPGIYREKHDGVYVYFSDDTSVYKIQVQKRKSLISRSAAITLSDSKAVKILVAIIQQDSISAENILCQPEIKKSKLKLTHIQGFMEYHGLLKKIPDSRP